MEHARPGPEHPIETLIDLDRYPIKDLRSGAAGALIEHGRTELDDLGALALPGFIRADALTKLVAETTPLLPRNFIVEQDHTVYFAPADDAFPSDHPKRRSVSSSKGGLSYDYIAKDSALSALYTSETLIGFVSALLGGIPLHRHADPLAACNINIFGPGQKLGWHFDRADFVTSLALQDPQDGGAFEFVPWLRSDDDENYDGVAAVLDGARERVRRLDMPAGTLALFKGHHSLHRVTEVRGARPRLVAVLSYVREPGRLFQPWERELFYGHAKPVA